jgi:hypothetical protein
MEPESSLLCSQQPSTGVVKYIINNSLYTTKSVMLLRDNKLHTRWSLVVTILTVGMSASNSLSIVSYKC